MTKVNLSIPKGTRDFTPQQMFRRNYIFSTLQTVFKKYGFQPIETPSMEQLSTLLGKYGDEGDKLLFKILNSGDYLKDVSETDKAEIGKLTSHICEKGLRYDLTVPFARFVVMHRNEISFPFRRFQIQPVWRADRPQRGRYREFFQCDVDVIGTNSLMEEANLIKLIDEAYQKLNINVTIKLNNRKILQGIAECIGAAEMFTDFTVALDKLDKIGWENVKNELIEKGISETACQKVDKIINNNVDFKDLPNYLREVLSESQIAQTGISEIETTLKYLTISPIKNKIEFDITLARGLNYYTGAIFEVKAQDVQIGSICGGGRYDNLTGIFGMPEVSGVGVSFGADRIYDVMNELNLFPEDVLSSTKVLIINFGGEEEQNAFALCSNLRNKDISCEIFPEAGKLKKQFAYADQKNIPWTLMQGSEEKSKNIVQLKNMKSGEQIEIKVEDLENFTF